MSDKVSVEVKPHGRSFQDTGNPVLDSTVNLLSSRGVMSKQAIAEVHAAILAIAKLEPGGLRHQIGNYQEVDLGTDHA